MTSYSPEKNVVDTETCHKKLSKQLQQIRNNTVQSSINIDELINAAANDQTQYLEGHTIDSISNAIYTSLHSRLANMYIQSFYEKLTGFRYVDEVYMLHLGKYVRWIRSDKHPPKLENGGIVVDIKIGNDGVLVLCKLGRVFTQYKFNDCLTYQKLSHDEMLVLTAYSSISNINR
jgi:hypothetical protein